MKYARLTVGMAALVLTGSAIAASGARPPRPLPPVNQQQSYINAMQLKLRQNWTPLQTGSPVKIPAAWSIHKDGRISQLRLLTPGGVSPDNERAALRTVESSAPFAPLPPALGDRIDVQYTFETNKYPPPLGLTVAQAVARYGPATRPALIADCRKIGASYPPQAVVMVGLKEERLLLVFVPARDKRMSYLYAFPLVSFSGGPGPKLKQGDRQIPEGIYKITGMQAQFRLSLAVDYPNQTDRLNAAADKRTNLGGEILVHGGSVSTGCLVISPDDMKKLFLLVHDVHCHHARLIIAPGDLTARQPQIDLDRQPSWLPSLYDSIKKRLLELPVAEAMRQARGAAR